MRTALALIFAAALPAFAQFDLATTRDGSTLYFSALPDAAGNIRIYRWTKETGVTLFADRPDLAAPPYGIQLRGTQITDDGAVLYHAGPNCAVGSGVDGNHCPAGQTVINIPGIAPFSEDGFLLISPNGRYGVSTPWGSGGFWVDWMTGESRAIDFGGGGFGIPDTVAPFHPNQHAVADNGSFLLLVPESGMNVRFPDGTLSAVHAGASIISADGSTVAGTYSDPCCLGDRAFASDVASGHTAIFLPPVALSGDGHVAYLEAVPNIAPFSFARLLVARSDGTGAELVGFVPGGAHELAISGDGRFVYAAAGATILPEGNTVFRFDRETGAVDEIAPPAR